MKIHILEPWISGLLENQQSVNPFLLADCMIYSAKVGVHSENRETELVPMVGHGDGRGFVLSHSLEFKFYSFVSQNVYSAERLFYTGPLALTFLSLKAE